MTPQQRKQASEDQLSALGIPINLHLPLVESEDEVRLRTRTELLRRLVALWAVAGTAVLKGNDFFRRYMTDNDLLEWLSPREKDFLLASEPSERQLIQSSWRLECLYFLGWCAGLVERIEIPTTQSSVEPFLHLFPQQGSDLSSLEAAIAIRPLPEILDWSDLLYRLHWSVRDAHLRGAPMPFGVEGGVVQEWHQAVNWMTRYDDEDDWDMVGTDT